MPLASSSLPTELTIGVVDHNNETSTSSIFLPTAFGLETLVTNIAAFEAVLAGLTDGYITGGGLSRRFNQTDDPPAEGGIITSNVQRKGVFIFENSFGGYNKYTIPSIDRALVLPGGVQINRQAAAVQAYVTFMLSGLGGVAGSTPIGGNGYDLVRLVDAYEDTVSRPNTKRR